MGRHQGLDKYVDEMRSAQRNMVFPDTVRNGRAADVFFGADHLVVP